MKISDLYNAGTSAWLDDLSRGSIDNGTDKSLVSRVARREIYGVTTNPAIFTAAITKDPSYQNDIKTIRNLNAEEIIEQLTTDDVRKACQVLRPIYDETKGVDGRVSIEVDPRLAYEAEATISQAKRLWEMIDQPNLMIKVPPFSISNFRNSSWMSNTAEGLPKLAVPTDTPFAPARIISNASRPDATPPIPIIGIFGNASLT